MPHRKRRKVHLVTASVAGVTANKKRILEETRTAGSEGSGSISAGWPLEMQPRRVAN